MAASPNKVKYSERSSPFRWLKTQPKLRQSVQPPDIGHREGGRRKSPSHYEDLLRVQIAAVSESPTPDPRRKWRPKFFTFLRSPKVSPSTFSDRQEEEEVEEDQDEEEEEASVSACPSALTTGTGGANPMSTTAHLLSLLDPDDLKHFHKRINGYDDHHAPARVSPSHRVTKIQVRPHSTFTFQIVGNNGNKLIEQILMSKGWLHLPNAPQSDVKCLWVESLILFSIWDFKEGYQMLNHIPNTHLLSNKLCLLRCLQEYNGLSNRGFGLKMADFLPESYRLDLKQDKVVYCQKHKGQLWICKPAMFNQGKGIFLVRNSDELQTQLRQLEAEELSKNHFSKPPNVRIIQRYIESPLLLEGRKADIRAYMLIASTKPFVVLFHEGYVRLSCSQYDPSSSDLLTHLTNQCMQRKNPQYEAMKEETVWDMNRLLNYISYHVLPGHPSQNTFAYSTFRNQMCRIMLHCFHAVKSKLDRRIGLFELLGFDFLIDCALKVWLLEINVNPSLQVNCQVLKQTIPSVLGESVDVSHECFEKSRQGLRILPLQSKKNFVLLYCEQMPYMKTIPKPLPLPRKRYTTGPSQAFGNQEQSGKSPAKEDPGQQEL